MNAILLAAISLLGASRSVPAESVVRLPVVDYAYTSLHLDPTGSWVSVSNDQVHQFQKLVGEAYKGIEVEKVLGIQPRKTGDAVVYVRARAVEPRSDGSVQRGAFYLLKVRDGPEGPVLKSLRILRKSSFGDDLVAPLHR